MKNVLAFTGLILVKTKPHFQLNDKINLSPEDLKINLSLPENITILSTTNILSDSYTYQISADLPTPGTYWDLGSIWCDSDYDGVCDAFMKIPDDGCSGPGCGRGMWQDLNRQCTKLSDYKYSLEERENRAFIWPESLYSRYSSTCNPEVEIKYERNCR